ncbi:MAG: DUF402 domain-containing protein [Promethearchaeota archaeon]
MYVKIRGIYSTALSILFKESANYEITFPSHAIWKRLKLSPVFKPADVIINDRSDGFGIVVESKEADLFSRDFPLHHENIPGLAIIEANSSKYSVFRGEIISVNYWRGYSQVLLDRASNLIGILPETNFKTGERVVVQIQEPGIGKRKPRLSRVVTCPSSYVVVIPEHKVTFSKNITDPSLRLELMEIGQAHPIYKHDGFGLIFRSACNDASMDDIKEDLDDISLKMIQIRDNMDVDGIGLIADPIQMKQWQVLFSKETLDFLDDKRRQFVQTMRGHHYWRLVTSKTTDSEYIVDFAEYLMTNNAPGLEPDTISSRFANFAHEKFSFPRKGDLVKILHYKPDGSLHVLQPGVVQDALYSKDYSFIDNLESTFLVLKRTFEATKRQKAFYDGFEDIEIQAGDYSITSVKEHFPVICHEYHRDDGTLLGCYFSISTPVQMLPGSIFYIDLEIDVVEDADGKRKIIDSEKLEVAIQSGHISEEQGIEAKEIATKILEGTINTDLSSEDNV